MESGIKVVVRRTMVIVKKVVIGRQMVVEWKWLLGEEWLTAG